MVAWPKEYKPPKLLPLARASRTAWGGMCEQGSAADSHCYTGSSAEGRLCVAGGTATDDCFAGSAAVL